MLNIKYSTKFKKDFKICVKRKYDMSLLQGVIDTLKIPKPLPEKNKDHNLSGNYSMYRECHILPNWLLIYRITENKLELYRTGTHADLFGM